MDPEQQHAIYIQERIANIKENAHCMAECQFTTGDLAADCDGYPRLIFTVSMQVWQDRDWDHDQFSEFCKKIVQNEITLNNSSYKAIADELYTLIATQMPGREIWININSGNYGINIKYQN